LIQRLDYMTWVVLKAHTRNRTGTVRLRSTDPRDTPAIEFNYFKQGGEQDLQAMLEGVRYVRELNKTLQDERAIFEEVPGPGIDSDEKLAEFIRKNAWGHHASCTCAIGDPANDGVVSSDFRVHGVERLRIVDASVFPKIPGFFIASATYTIAEKAADVILSAYRKEDKHAVRYSHARVQ
jgi:choline dehydrogenase-like flavoprotein